LDDSIVDEQEIVREVEAEEREEEIRLKAIQARNTGSFFSRLFNRNHMPPALSSPVLPAGRMYQRDSFHARNYSNDGEDYDDDDGYSQPRGGNRWQQAQSKFRAAGAFGNAGRKVSVTRRETLEDDSRPIVPKGKLQQTATRIIASSALSGKSKSGAKPPPPPPQTFANDVHDDELPPPADDDFGWDAPPPASNGEARVMRQMNEAHALAGRSGGYNDMPPPADDDDMPPPPDFEEDAPPPLVDNSHRRSRK
jgi:hypothetical protein